MYVICCSTVVTWYNSTNKNQAGLGPGFGAAVRMLTACEPERIIVLWPQNVHAALVVCRNEHFLQHILHIDHGNLLNLTERGGSREKDARPERVVRERDRRTF